MLTVKMKIDRDHAISLGLAREGEVSIQLEDEHVAHLTEPERKHLLFLLNTYPPAGERARFVDPTPEGLVAWIKDVCAARAREVEEQEKRDEQKRKVMYDAVRAYLDAGDVKKLFRESHIWNDRIGGYCYQRSNYIDMEQVPWDHPMFAKLKKQVDEFAAVLNEQEKKNAIETQKKREEQKQAEEDRVAAEEKARWEAVRALITLEDDLARFDDGYMGEKEQKDLVREELFRPLENLGLARYDRIKPSEVEDHDEECAYPEIVFETVDEGVELDADEYRKLLRVRECLEKHPHKDHSAEPLLHEAKCKSCDAGFGRTSVLVSFTWHGWNLSREYAL